jgi:hypothetical protein
MLPRLGGPPSVWSVAVLFLQTMLLGDYAYPHILMRAVGPALAVGIHVVLLITAGLTLPLSITGLTAPAAAERVWIDDYSNIIGAVARNSTCRAGAAR